MWPFGWGSTPGLSYILKIPSPRSLLAGSFLLPPSSQTGEWLPLASTFLRCPSSLKTQRRYLCITLTFIECVIIRRGGRRAPGHATGHVQELLQPQTLPGCCMWMWLVVLTSSGSDKYLLSLPKCGVAARESSGFLMIFRTRSKILPCMAGFGTMVYNMGLLSLAVCCQQWWSVGISGLHGFSSSSY